MSTKRSEKSIKQKTNLRHWVSFGIIFVLIPLLVVAGIWLFDDRSYTVISMLLALLACVPFFLMFEHRRPGARDIVVITVMSALSAASRIVFAWLPSFKPVTAMSIIAGTHFGPESGFLTGAISAIVSNIFFGQGPWTPFQMLTWGLIGFGAGLFEKLGWMKNKIFLYSYGFVAGFAFSALLNVWTTVTVDGGFYWSKYWTLFVTALPFSLVYAVSNVIFLFLLSRPIGRKLERVKTKYGLMEKDKG